MTHIEIHPGTVAAWGRSTRHTGAGVRGVRHRIVTAEESAGCAHASGLATRGASDRFTDATEQGVGTVADALTHTGDKLVSTASIVRSTDDESTDLFLPWTGRHGESRP